MPQLDSGMDEAIRELEREWLESGEEADRHAWLCAKMRSEGPEWEPYELEGIVERALAAYGFDPDISVRCRIGYDLEEPDPLARLSGFSDHRAWWPVADVSEALAAVLSVKRMGMIYPHDDHDTSAVHSEFRALFSGAPAFANFRTHSGTTSWGRSSTPFEGRLEGWEVGDSLALGATLGPLVGYLAVNVRNSI